MKNDKKIDIKRLLVFVGAFFVLAFYFFDSFYQKDSKTLENSKNGITQSTDSPKPGSSHFHGDSSHDHSSQNGKNNSTQSSFVKQQKAILLLGKNYPQSKEELMTLVLAESPFKNKEVKPHSTDEITQQQQGALKVLALRMILKSSSSSKDKEQLMADLQTIIKNAKDPTMSKVARAVLKSVKRGRPFFKDFGDAISQL